jgi:nucleotide-binding universal stress UspA family protein
MARCIEPLALKRVLCATDFSENAASALEAAVACARPSKAEILIVHVVPFPARSAVGTVCPSKTPGIDERTRADLIERLDRFARPAVAAGAQTRSVLRQGDPCGEIVAESEAAPVDLIVMGRHSREAPARWFLGSVAEAMVSRAKCPVMVVEACPRRRAGGPRHVLCAVDLGETTAATLNYAAALTTALEADLLVLHVVACPGEDTAPDARSRLAGLVASASIASGRARERVVAGVPYQQILTVGRENAIDPVVVGSHAGGITDRQFIGSTTLHLLRRSECAVLVVPAQVIAETVVEDAPIGVARGVAGREPGAEFAPYAGERRAGRRRPE